jgi:hypothetical protein
VRAVAVRPEASLLGGVTSCHCTVLPQHRSCTIAASSQEAGAAVASSSHIQPQRSVQPVKNLRCSGPSVCSAALDRSYSLLATLGPGRQERTWERKQSVSCLQYCNTAAAAGSSRVAVCAERLCLLRCSCCAGEPQPGPHNAPSWRPLARAHTTSPVAASVRCAAPPCCRP